MERRAEIIPQLLILGTNNSPTEEDIQTCREAYQNSKFASSVPAYEATNRASDVKAILNNSYS